MPQCWEQIWEQVALLVAGGRGAVVALWGHGTRGREQALEGCILLLLLSDVAPTTQLEMLMGLEWAPLPAGESWVTLQN